MTGAATGRETQEGRGMAWMSSERRGNPAGEHRKNRVAGWWRAFCIEGVPTTVTERNVKSRCDEATSAEARVCSGDDNW